MGIFVDLSGQKFGMVTVVSRASSRNKDTFFNCKCDCGKIFIARADHLRRGETRSCGCQIVEAAKRALTTHGMTDTQLYRIYRGMIKRCEKPNSEQARLYKGRGIKVCDEWHNFETFRDWSLTNGYSENLTIDRIDNNGNYEPSNCRWADLITQANNKRTNRRIEYNGETKTLAQWARVFHIKYQKLWLRLKRGWEFERAVA
jgi:hypothetical protein